MANIKSAKKRISVINAKTAQNKMKKSRVKTIEKSLLAAIAENNVEEAMKKMLVFQKVMAKYADNGLFHKNKAARKVSRLRTKLNAISK